MNNAKMVALKPTFSLYGGKSLLNFFQSECVHRPRPKTRQHRCDVCTDLIWKCNKIFGERLSLKPIVEK